jgi:hypothetical protein
VLLPPPSGDVPPSAPDVTEAPDVPEAPDAVPVPPLEALPPLMTPLATLPEGMPLVTRPLVDPDELPLAGAPLVVGVPVVPPEPDELTDPDEPDDGPIEPEAEPLLPEDPEATTGEVELEHARLIVTPTQNNPEHHLADMGPPQRKFEDEDGRRPHQLPKVSYKYHVLWRARCGGMNDGSRLAARFC